MIEMPTQRDLASPHHRKAIGVLVAAVIIFGLTLTVIYLRPAVPKSSIPSADDLTRSSIIREVTSASPTALSSAQKSDLIKRVKMATGVSASAERASIIGQLQGQ